MIEKFETVLRKIRTTVSRTEWGIRLLRLPRDSGAEIEPGLVMIQIDGLSRSQLEIALENGNMPFLKSMLDREGYHLHTVYSGLPASTPAFQGELFYGQKGVVPAFGFQNRKTGRLVRMYDPEASGELQNNLEKKHTGLLEGGSSYTNIFSGGAAESHFCPATHGWGSPGRQAPPLNRIGFFLSHSLRLLQTAGLLVVETGLAIKDFFRGMLAGKELIQELKFIPLRVIISILLRDLVMIGSILDVTRGLPVIHLNFIGYDEQAHRRGPSSRFAHWALKGIDDSIRRIYHAAHRSLRRDYDIWVYSDHGQEDSIPYPVEHGMTVQEAVARVLGKYSPGLKIHPQDRHGAQLERSRWLGASFLAWLAGGPGDDEFNNQTEAVVMAMGSIGHVYAGRELEEKERHRIAQQLVESACIPLVLVPDQPGEALAWTRDGLFRLPDQARNILGEDHPFLHEAGRDLASLCHHPDAGDWILSGWRRDQPTISFPMENGSHTGPGPQETRGFALLPTTSPVQPPDAREYLRALDLREGALHVLGRHPSEHRPWVRPSTRDSLPLRVMTYNVHSCRGMDGKLSPSRIAKVIAHYDPDVVALQELDVGRPRTREVDQAQVIAKALEMDFHFFPSFHLERGKFGNAILSRYPMRLVQAGPLPGLPHQQARGALWAVVRVGDQDIQFITAHLGLLGRERLLQVRALMGDQWLGDPKCQNPVVVLGDFNALPRSGVCRHLLRRFRDTQLELKDSRPQRTFFGRYPVGRIDHIFVSPEFQVHGVQVPRTTLTRLASDHLPLIAEVALPRT